MSPEIVFLDDSSDLRDLLCLYIRNNMKVASVGFSSFQDFQKSRDIVLNSKIAVLDIELGANQPSGIDAYKWLMENSYQGKIFFLTGHGNLHPGVKEAMGLNAPILEKPMSGPSLLKVLTSALSSQAPSEQSGNYAKSNIRS